MNYAVIFYLLIMILLQIFTCVSYESNEDYENSEEDEEDDENYVNLESKLEPISNKLDPFNHHYQMNHFENEQHELIPWERPGTSSWPTLQKKKKWYGSGKKKNRFIGPLFFKAITKLIEILPIIKFTLLTLFALVLFAKKAFLVSIGSFLLVIYEAFYKKRQSDLTIFKNRDDNTNNIGEIPWWKREIDAELIVPEMQHRETDLSLKRWWNYPERNDNQRINNNNNKLWTNKWERKVLENILMHNIDKLISQKINIENKNGH